MFDDDDDDDRTVFFDIVQPRLIRSENLYCNCPVRWSWDRQQLLLA